jgi:pentatricopeptide repeat protein
MRSRGVQCNVHTYSALMNVCIKVSRLARRRCSGKRAWQAAGFQWQQAAAPSISTQSPLPHSPECPAPATLQCDACELALDVFKEMRTEGVRPNVVTYNTLVDVYGKIGQWERAVRVLDDMTQDVSGQGRGSSGPLLS